jgi:AbrB family looped-hinge helix DNA binding protein
MTRFVSIVDDAGQVALPAEILEALGLRAGDKVSLLLEDGQVRLVPAGRADGTSRGHEPVRDAGKEGDVRLPKLADPENIWANYDPEAAREALRQTKGILAGVDAEALIADIYAARGQARRGKLADDYDELD